jgi:glutamate racemase
MRIGVFDSGVGGLTVLRELLRHCPGHSTVYLGDTARVPYGTKSADTVRRYAMHNTDFLLREGIDLLVIACNTASAFAIGELRNLPVPVFGVIEPGAKLATERTKTGRIGVLGTAGTVRSGAYERALRELRPEAEIHAIACPMFVPLAEEGWVEGPIARATAEKYLGPWRGNESAPDTVILGCTHYPLLKPVIQEVLGEAAGLVDSAEAVAMAVKEQISGTRSEPSPAHRIFLTDASEGFRRQAKLFLGDQHHGVVESIEVVDLEPAV